MQFCSIAHQPLPVWVIRERDEASNRSGHFRYAPKATFRAIDGSLKSRPYTTLALALGLGFLFGVTWSR